MGLGHRIAWNIFSGLDFSGSWFGWGHGSHGSVSGLSLIAWQGQTFERQRHGPLSYAHTDLEVPPNKGTLI